MRVVVALGAISLGILLSDCEEGELKVSNLPNMSSDYLLVFNRITQISSAKVRTVGVSGPPGRMPIYVDLDSHTNSPASTAAFQAVLSDVSLKAETYTSAGQSCAVREVFGRPACVTEDLRRQGLLTFWNTAGVFVPEHFSDAIPSEEVVTTTSESLNSYEIWVVEQGTIVAEADVIVLDKPSFFSVILRSSKITPELISEVLQGLTALVSMPSAGTAYFIDMDVKTPHAPYFSYARLFIH